MIDGHIHFHKQPYNLDTINKMVEVAICNNLSELHLLDHTHKFIEFSTLYETLKNNDSAWEWYANKTYISINEYLDFIKLVRKMNFPIKLKFGLEVCYFEEKEAWLRNELQKYDFDFVIGAVHFVDNFPFDLKKEVWVNVNVDLIYKRYYEIMESLIKSKLFTSLAHPDSIKLFNNYPSYDLKPTYEKLARCLKEYNLKTENNTGLWRYDFSYPGLNKDLYKILKEYDVKIEKSSDAHIYDKIGYKFKDIDIY